MSNVFKTLCIPAAQLTKAVAICNALGFPDRGTFIGKMALSGAEPLSGPDTRTMAGYIASGVFDSASPLLGTSSNLFVALKGAPGISQADCDAFVAALEVTSTEPISRREMIARECNGTEVTTPWVQPGSTNPYQLGAAVTYNGKSWRNVMDNNVWAPGVTGWNLFWTSGPTWLEWAQPGSTNPYPLGARVAHLGKHWQSAVPANVWEPGIAGSESLWTQVP